MVTRTVLVALLVGLSSCKPNIAGRASLIEQPTVIAVRSVPAEIDVNGADQTGRLQALFVGPDAKLDNAALSWALCIERKPLTTRGAVNTDCLAPSGSALTQLGQGKSVPFTLPEDVCNVFGPTPPKPEPDQPPLRPADPDITGGYYQPSRVLFDSGEYAVGVTRIAFCGLPSATQEQVIDFNTRYRPNENPAVDKLRLHHANGKREDLEPGADAAPVRVGRGEQVDLRVSWADCSPRAGCDSCDSSGGDAGADAGSGCPSDCAPTDSCTGSESYVLFDRLVRKVLTRREAMRVSWYATDGSFEHDRTGNTAEEAATTHSENTWTAPAGSGEVRMWVVLRDDRGGVGYEAYRVEVR